MSLKAQPNLIITSKQLNGFVYTATKRNVLLQQLKIKSQKRIIYTYVSGVTVKTFARKS